MKKDRLEEFINANRGEFDTIKETPEWSQAPKGRNGFWFGTFAGAAAMAIILAVATFVFSDFRPNNGTGSNGENQLNFSLSFSETKLYYDAQVESQISKICQLAGSESMICSEMDVEMQELSSEFETLKRDFEDGMDNSDVVEAMMMNYRMKLEILESVLTDLQRQSNIKTANNEN